MPTMNWWGFVLPLRRISGPSISIATPEKWPFSADQLCYFKCSAVDPDFQGGGVGKSLLMHSINEAQGDGCLGGLAHIWKQSPNNSAFEYFSRCGGRANCRTSKSLAAVVFRRGLLLPCVRRRLLLYSRRNALALLILARYYSLLLATTRYYSLLTKSRTSVAIDISLVMPYV